MTLAMARRDSKFQECQLAHMIVMVEMMLIGIMRMMEQSLETMSMAESRMWMRLATLTHTSGPPFPMIVFVGENLVANCENGRLKR